MNRNIKRVAFALLISTSSFLTTVIWFRSGQTHMKIANRKPIAKLNESLNDVQRKPVQRVIWETVSKNDSLYAGEAIRTAANGEAKIVLLKSGAVIHLDSDSLVVLEENEKGLSLDFLEGNMYVQGAEDSKTDDITLKTGNGEVKLNSADLSLSRSQEGNVNMSVFKGQAELQQGDKKIALAKESSATFSKEGFSLDKDRVQITWPYPGETVLLNLMGKEKLAVQFKPLPAGYKVFMALGTSRSNMKDTGAVVDGNVGKLTTEGKAGKWYFRLVAKSDNPDLPPLTSSVLSVNIDPKAAPSPIEPSGNEPVVKGENHLPVHFQWVNRHSFQSQVLEISQDKNFKDILNKKVFYDQSSNYVYDLKAGTYYWRVTGFINSQGQQEGLSSAPVQFLVQDAWEMKAPILASPQANQLIPYMQAQKEGLLLKWTPPQGVKEFAVVMERKEDSSWKSVIAETADTAILRLTDLIAGDYRWKVASIHPKNKNHKESEWSFFSIGSMPKMEWADANTDYEFATSTPTLKIQWRAFSRATASYRYFVKPKEGTEELAWKSTKETSVESEIPNEGNYIIQVQALNNSEQIIAESDLRTIMVKKFSLLPAPKWANNTPETFEADAKGNLQLAWQNVEGADHYIMIIENEGKIVQKKKVDRTLASLSRLKPGKYKVHLKSVDRLKREGNEMSSKELIVPQNSDIGAPRIKSIKVK
ncbi:MAG: hypothetical protein H6623_01395 [Bdellovibrionaceae bacterium]|nr:hypothetical protein [Pseudobdellovibrionaceae bacterium]